MSGRRNPYVTLSLYPTEVGTGSSSSSQREDKEEEEGEGEGGEEGAMAGGEGQEHYSPPDYEGGAHPK